MEDLTETDRSFWMLKRMIGVFIILLCFGLGVYGFDTLQNHGTHGLTITLSLLLGLPFSIGALSAYGLRVGSKTQIAEPFTALFIYILGVLFVGSLILKEGVICVAMISPIWIISGMCGILVVKNLHKNFNEKANLNCSILIILPFALSLFQSYFPPKTQTYTVSRSIVINASAQEVWPSLLSLAEIGESEGKWNITQNILRVPRPSSAIVKVTHEQRIRHAQWGRNISFEEHITKWEPNAALRWEFTFPNDSVHKYTDRHISPDGTHLKIIDGGYNLKTLSPTQTKITLDTVYRASTPINSYSALWGELILGDIQNNILEIIKTRNENVDRL